MTSRAELTPLTERLWSKVDKTESCWLWTGALNGHGYGRLNLGDGHWGSAHRVTYELVNGPVPAGLVLDHLCGVTRCVNPDHLRPATNLENVTRGRGPNMAAYRAGTCLAGHPRSESYYKRDGSLAYCRPCRNVRRSA